MNILIAKDEAFNFTYKANIDSLASLGDVSFFSPIRNTVLPPCDLLYLPGGYPELFVERLSTNRALMGKIKEYAECGGRIFAECGGFMYLCSEIDGNPMCGVFPFKATMAEARLHLGYRMLYTEPKDKPNGISLKGHEFHYSDIKETIAPGIRKIGCQYSAKGTKVNTALYQYKKVIAGYTHWYWAETGFPLFLFNE